MGTKTISERQSPVEFTAGADTAETGVVKGVCICGLSSANRRDYPPDVLRRAATKYEGAQVYLDHLDERGRSRGVREWFGEIRNVRSRPDGRPEGDLHFPAEHHFAKEFVSRATSFKRSLGLSHVVEAKTSHKNGREVVEDISTVHSVDLVASPATNSSLTESRRTAVGLTAKELSEWVTRHPDSTLKQITAAKRFAEDMGAAGYGDAPVMDAPPADATAPGDALKSGIKQGIMDLLDSAKSFGGDTDDAAVLKKIKTLMAAHGDVTGSDASAEEPADGGADDDPTTPESKRPDWNTVVLECAKKSYDPNMADMAVLTMIPTESGREALITHLKKLAESATQKPGETPRAAGRAKVAEQKTDKPGDGPPDLKTLKERIKG